MFKKSENYPTLVGGCAKRHTTLILTETNDFSWKKSPNSPTFEQKNLNCKFFMISYSK
jgi:hypothetical protein